DTERLTRNNLRSHVSVLAGAIGERNMQRYSRLQSAADYIRTSFIEAGYTVEEQEFDSARRAVHNIEAQLTDSDRPGAWLVVGAHYDSAIGSPGANDNATGVAALLELARLLNMRRPAPRIRFVAFANE